MIIPTYVFSGFFESGKTTLINNLLKENRETAILVIQFENGIEKLNENIDVIQFSKIMLENDSQQICDNIKNQLMQKDYDEIWIEWNGFAEIKQLQELTIQMIDISVPTLEIQKVIYVADSNKLQMLIQEVGGTTIEQLAMSDLVVLQNYENAKQKYQIKQLIREINGDARIRDIGQFIDKYYEMYSNNRNSLSRFFMYLVLVVISYLIFIPVSLLLNLPINAFTNIFIGIIFQAIPFLLLGVTISSLIQVFLPEPLIEKWFPQNIFGGMIVALIAGFCLPVCDCASIPIFKSLVKKGVPVAAGVTFMIVSPIINPVVIISTMHAFPMSPVVVISRFILGIVCSLCIGLFFAFSKEKNVEKINSMSLGICNCGCYIGSDINDKSFKNRMNLFFRHSQTEFLTVGKHILIGSMIATVSQLVFNKIFFIGSTGSFVQLLIIMMVMAFALSLCSSSDAIIARGFSSSFPLGAILGFLVFGPMMDFKNIFLLGSSFSIKFIAKLLVTCFVVCFIIILIYTQLFLGGWY